MRLPILGFCLFLLLSPMIRAASVGGAVERAYVDSTGRVHVVYQGGLDIQVPPEQDQVSSASPIVGPDNSTVGWLVEVPNCCTSYPIATTLVIYKSGRVIRRIGDGMMLYKWQFLSGGRKVAVSSGTVHGMQGVHLTLYDAVTGRRLSTWDGADSDIPPKWGAGAAH